ncbi:helix-turn-helix transcriptional regulator [Rhizobium hainanense]|uniref:Regulatory protein, luxR family n=1 Tax=Rhizobium hainanense TaxID=52131 RepID=A0A1C3W9F1_9HYPH|nr:LuxR C-terminal-related transcriptional regulator [Rhizobium hainanense]SCB36531.1 regulatory protein, luxR family [Rhizobium hainanense]
MSPVQIPITSLQSFGLATARLCNVRTAAEFRSVLGKFFPELEEPLDAHIELDPWDRAEWQQQRECLEYRVYSNSPAQDVHHYLARNHTTAARCMILSFYAESRIVAVLRIIAANGEPLSQSVIALIMAIAAHAHAALQRICINVENLSVREREVACLVASGFRDREIGDLLGISFSTVRTHINKALNRLNCPNRTKLAALILQEGLTTRA